MAQRRRWPWLLAVALLALGAFWIGSTRGDAARVELVRKAEAAEAKAAGLIVAERVKAAQVEHLAEESETLRNEIERLREVAPTAEVREVVRWRTRSVEVPIDRIVEIPVDVPRGTLDCPGMPDLPPIQLYVTGSDARLRSDSGNVFAVGEVEVWRVADPDVLLMAAPWEADLTELVTVIPAPTYRRLGYWLGASRRLSIDTLYHPLSDQESWSTSSESRWTGRGGVSWRWRGLTLMAGANTDPGVEILVAWSRRAS